ncbi:MAG: thymidine phosphorylase [Cyanobacteria bacterium PR.3.49]|nr:thymidine phosphorylase [Cyanobacteria bacterium PR.3.49]
MEKITDLIADKRNGKAHSAADIARIINGLMDGSVKDHQLTAWLMAAYLKGLDLDETTTLTDLMSRSGSVLDLSAIGDVVCDKHSTGGVGDKTTLVLVPLLAAAGLPMAKLSGRGLEHTGGTLDKLEAIPGFNVNLSQADFIAQVKRIGAAIGSTTQDFAPADGKLYKLRNETATVDHNGLGSASVMCKKLAAGANLIVLDVKTGLGAFMDTEERASAIATTMVEIGKRLGKPTVAVVSDMNQPLGFAVGHALEVKEAVETLKGEGPADLTELCLYLGALALEKAGKFADREAARKALEQHIADGSALAKFEELIEAQGGDKSIVDKPELMPTARFTADLTAPDGAGFVETANAMVIAKAAKAMAFGNDDATIDLAVGVVVHVKIGDAVSARQPIATVHARSEEQLKEALAGIRAAFTFSTEVVKPVRLIHNVFE